MQFVDGEGQDVGSDGRAALPRLEARFGRGGHVGDLRFMVVVPFVRSCEAERDRIDRKGLKGERGAGGGREGHDAGLVLLVGNGGGSLAMAKGGGVGACSGLPLDQIVSRGWLLLALGGSAGLHE
ncbi:hypothetical protein ZWY2020_002841 [Hordeum vulgare]|nr:hypothetical protein ZWY2020_002841 [Hordeum vulgare]